MSTEARLEYRFSIVTSLVTHQSTINVKDIHLTMIKEAVAFYYECTTPTPQLKQLYDDEIILMEIFRTHVKEKYYCNHDYMFILAMYCHAFLLSEWDPRDLKNLRQREFRVNSIAEWFNKRQYLQRICKDIMHAIDSFPYVTFSSVDIFRKLNYRLQTRKDNQNNFNLPYVKITPYYSQHPPNKMRYSFEPSGNINILAPVLRYIFEFLTDNDIFSFYIAVNGNLKNAVSIEIQRRHALHWINYNIVTTLKLPMRLTKLQIGQWKGDLIVLDTILENFPELRVLAIDTPVNIYINDITTPAPRLECLRLLINPNSSNLFPWIQTQCVNIKKLCLAGMDQYLVPLSLYDRMGLFNPDFKFPKTLVAVCADPVLLCDIVENLITNTTHPRTIEACSVCLFDLPGIINTNRKLKTDTTSYNTLVMGKRYSTYLPYGNTEPMREATEKLREPRNIIATVHLHNHMNCTCHKTGLFCFSKE